MLSNTNKLLTSFPKLANNLMRHVVVYVYPRAIPSIVNESHEVCLVSMWSTACCIRIGLLILYSVFILKDHAVICFSCYPNSPSHVRGYKEAIKRQSDF